MIGLAESYNADFIIVKESQEYPCQYMKNVLHPKYTNNMKYSKENKNPSLPFLNESYHNHASIDSVSHDLDSIQWDSYDIVLCINTCIPSRIIDKYPSVLWCYWIGENDVMTKKIGNYDILLDQDVTKQSLPSFSIGFPYTFVGPTTMETIAVSYLGMNGIKKEGIYMEINNTTERPVKSIPPIFATLSKNVSMPILIHSQDILENEKQLYKAKYYVKLLGRRIRGNSVLETISSGTMVLANRKLVVYSDLVLEECHIEKEEDATKKILYYEGNPDEYTRVIREQRALLERMYFKKPMDALFERYRLKQTALSKDSVDRE